MILELAADGPVSGILGFEALCADGPKSWDQGRGTLGPGSGLGPVLFTVPPCPVNNTWPDWTLGRVWLGPCRGPSPGAQQAMLEVTHSTKLDLSQHSFKDEMEWLGEPVLSAQIVAYARLFSCW